MDKTVKKSLKKLTKGSLMILAGITIGYIINFFTRLIIIRNLSQEDYGTVSLILTVINFTVIIAMLGLNIGITRYIAKYKAKKDSAKINSVIKSAVQISMISGLVFFLIIFFSSGWIAQIFHKEEIAIPLMLYALVIPLMLLTSVFISIFRGLGRADIKTIFQDILKNIILLALLGVLAAIGFSVLNLIVAYIVSAVILFTIFVVFMVKKGIKIPKIYKPSRMSKKLLTFSLPLSLRKFSAQIIAKSDILILGYFAEKTAVGIYNAALPLANYIPIFLTSMTFLYMPIATELYAQKNDAALKRNYEISTKWLFAATLPIFLILFFFPDTILRTLYGGKYVAANAALMILSSGYILHSALGLNGATLVAIGETRFIMWSSIISATLNIILNILLIPTFGILGAAAATSTAIVLQNVSISIKLYLKTKIHPFKKNFLKPIFISAIIFLALSFIIKKFLIVKWWMLPLFLAGFIVLYCAALLLTKSFDKEDIMILLAIERKMGLNLRFVKNTLKRFM